MTKVLNKLSDEVVEMLRAGQVGVLPSDTVYGLMCVAGNTAAVERLYKMKSREMKPGTVIAANVEQLVELGVKARYLKPVADYWPSSISIEIPNQVPTLTQGTGKAAFRIPADSALRSFLEKTGPLLTTSANHPGEATAATIQEAQAYFDDEVDFYVDGGNLSGRPPSTVIRIVDDMVEVIREGAVKIDEAGRIATA